MVTRKYKKRVDSDANQNGPVGNKWVERGYKRRCYQHKGNCSGTRALSVAGGDSSPKVGAKACKLAKGVAALIR